MAKKNSGQFTSERSRGNQHAKGNPPNRTTFKKGVDTMENSASWKGGIQKNTNDCTYISVGTRERKRRPRLVWENAYGKLPDGYVIYHLDGNKDNDEIENLEAISRAELVKRNNYKRKLT